MPRTIGRLLLVSGLLAIAAACTSGDDVSENTAVATPTTEAQSSSADESTTSVGAESSESHGTLPASPVEPAEDTFALPGLLDPSDEPIENDDDVRTGTLDNGLRYYVRHNERPGGKASLRLAIRAGSVDEIGPNTGVAHFDEHMMFNGTEQYPENELIDVLRSFGAEFGADINAYTSFDETVYELDVPNDGDSVEAAMNILDQWLSHASFDQAQIDSERGVVTDEWRSRTQTVDGRLSEVAEDLYLAGTPYEGRDPIGTEQSINSVPRDELVGFYDAWYRPDNAAVIVVGDIDVDDMVSEIEDRFGPALPRTDDMPARPDTTFPLETEPGFALHSDPDQPTVDVEVDLPIPVIESDGTAGLRANILDTMIYQSLIRRLNQDISAGSAPFDQILPGTNSFVASLDAPALYAITTSDRVDATLQALLDEYERANRFGFSDAETDVAKQEAQAGFDSQHDRSNTTQDVQYASQYVANFLTGDPYPAADDMHDLATQIIDAVTPEALDLRFRARWHNTAAHVIISTPQDEEADMPSESDVLAMIAAIPDRELEPREGGHELPDELMTAPAPVDPVSQEHMIDDGDEYFDPVEIVFPNGARVIATSNDIVEGQVAFQAASPGGSSLVADDDVADALFAADVVTSGGVGQFNQSDLDQILADRDAGVSASITPYVDGFAGGAATTDLETVFQLVNLYMTQPRFDPVALGQVQRSYGPVVDDPSSDPDTAGIDTLLDTRYGNEPRYTILPTPDQFATLDLDGVERVWRDRFGDASDWVFAFAGDFDMDELVELASSYLGTLPGDGTVEQWVDVEDPPPAGVVRQEVLAGTGDTSSLTLLFTSPAASVDGALRANTDVVTEVLTTRLTDVIREELGESYSPRAFTFINSDPDPLVQTYMQITGSPKRIASVADLVGAELDDLATNGPSDSEFQGAFAQVQESYQFVNNNTFLEELINDAIFPDRELQDYFDQFAAIHDVTNDTVRQFIADHVGTDQYIQVTVLPR
jgi:zinc protease